MENPVNIQETSTTTTVIPVQPKKKISLKTIIIASFLALLILGGGVGLYLSTQNQDIRQQASTATDYPDLPNVPGTNCPPNYIKVAIPAVPGTFICRYNPPPVGTPVGALCYGQANNCTTTALCGTNGYIYTTKAACVAAQSAPHCWSTANSCMSSDLCSLNGYTYPNAQACIIALNTPPTCTPGTCVNGKRCEYDPTTGHGQTGTHLCTVGTCTSDAACSSSEYCTTDPTSHTCVNKLPNGTVCNRDGQCASGGCVQGVCGGNGTNITCSSDASCPSGFLCNPTTHLCGQAGVSPVPTPTPRASASPNPVCKGAQQSCETGACCTGYVCQGVAGTRLCQQQQNSCNADETCGGPQSYIGFHCTQLDGNGECHDNPGYFDSFNEALTHAGTCGQADTACSIQHNLCGSFTIVKSGCNPTTSNPPTTPPSTPPTTLPPVCLNVSISKPNPVVGDTVTFTCGAVNGVNHYEFRVKLPNGTFQTVVAANANVSAAFTISSSGAHYAQCRVCTGTAASTCQAYGSL